VSAKRRSDIEAPKNYQRQAQFAQPISTRFAQPSISNALTKRNLINDKCATMSYYFAIIGTQDNPLFEYEFGTSKQGGDGVARFPEQARHMNQFIVHSSLDIVEEVQWAAGQMYVPLSYQFPSAADT
jgi:hypothetical protein